MFSFSHFTKSWHLLNVVRQTALSFVIPSNNLPASRSSGLTDLIGWVVNEPPIILKEKKINNFKKPKKTKSGNITLL